jgi:hypothetical protein
VARSAQPTFALPDASSDACPDQRGAVNRCASENALSQATSCDACVEIVYDSFVTDLYAAASSSSSKATSSVDCVAVTGAICRAKALPCLCDPCTGVYQAYLDCRLQAQPLLQQTGCPRTCNFLTTLLMSSRSGNVGSSAAVSSRPAHMMMVGLAGPALLAWIGLG